MPSIDKTPLYIDLDKRRRIEWNMNTALLVRKHIAPGSSLFESIGEYKDKATGETKKRYDINGDNLIVYLWACLVTGARLDGEAFNRSIEETGDLIDNKRKATRAYLEIDRLIGRYYGDEQGEAQAAAR